MAHAVIDLVKHKPCEEARQKPCTSPLHNIADNVQDIKDSIGDIKLSPIEIGVEDIKKSLNEIKQAVSDIPQPDLSEVATGTKLQEVSIAVSTQEQVLQQKTAEIKEAVQNIDLSAVEDKVEDAVVTLGQKIENIDTSHLAQESSLNAAKAEIVEAVNNAKPNIDFSALAKEATLTQGIQYLKDVTAKENTLNSAKEEILTEVEKGAQESTLLAESEAIKQAIEAGGGRGITLATEEEYSSFKDEMQTKINDILSEGL